MFAYIKFFFLILLPNLEYYEKYVTSVWIRWVNGEASLIISRF